MKILGKIIPGLEKLLVEIVDEPEAKDSNAIYIPEDKDKELLTGKVIGVGLVKHIDSTVVNPAVTGDKVLFEKWAGRDIEVGETKYKIINYDDVIAVIQ